MKHVPLSVPENHEQKIRPLFLATALSFAVGQIIILVYDVQNQNNQDTVSTIIGAVVASIVTISLLNKQISIKKLEFFVILAVGLVFIAEVLNLALVSNAENSGAPITVLVFVACLFGLLPQKRAALLSAISFIVFAGAVIMSGTVSLGLIIHVFCAALMIIAMSLHGISVQHQREEMQTYQKQAFTDQLTGLPNRRAMWERLCIIDKQYRDPDEAEERAPKYTLLLLDLDHFKRVNDKYGHPTGDRVLQEVGEWLQRFAQTHGGSLARWGGEEFIMLFPNITNNAIYILSDQLEQPLLLSDGLPTITLSGGGAFASECETLTEVLSLADHRLYTAKQGGRCQIRFTKRMSIDSLNDDLSEETPR